MMDFQHLCARVFSLLIAVSNVACASGAWMARVAPRAPPPKNATSLATRQGKRNTSIGKPKLDEKRRTGQDDEQDGNFVSTHEISSRRAAAAAPAPRRRMIQFEDDSDSDDPDAPT
ncbi:unnamed protein product, partial [Amoebophrya sp. A120]|eukprot:GSA120T00017878001.1